MALEDHPDGPLPDQHPIPLEGALVPTTEERNWGMACHLSALAGIWAGVPFLGPLVCWMLKKDTSKFVDEHGKESLNFQLNILIYCLISIPLIFCFVGFLTLSAAAIYGMIMPIIAGVKASSGEMYRYPFTFRLIK